MLDLILKAFQDEVEFYKNKNNDDWSNDKNEGFKLGVKYCEDIIKKIKRANVH